jgi:NADPH:quinone reductase-like Zn-dependent oxidoreductase
MAASPVNPSDLAFIKGGYGTRNAFPLIPGFEGSGTVVAAGSGILPRFLLGKRVSCATGAGAGGTWAEYVVAFATNCVPLPRHISLEQGAMAIVNPMTALAFFDMAKQDKHAAIVNTAASSALGKMVLRLGLRQRIPVIHIVRRQEQVDLLRSIGAQHVLLSTDSDFLIRFQNLSRELKATLILDAVGGGLSQQLFKAAPFGSTLIAYGFLSGEPSAIDTRFLAMDDKRIAGFFLPNWLRKKHPLALLKEVRKVRTLIGSDLATNIQKRFPLSAVSEAIDTSVKQATSGKVLLVTSS